MKLGFGLSLEQTQKLIMTPELRQAITVLQMSAQELSEYVEQEILENPLLEVYDHSNDNREDNKLENTEKKEEEKFDIDWQEYFNDRDISSGTRGLGEVSEEISYENFLTKAPTLQEYLLNQLSLVVTKEGEQKAGEYIIGNINDQGYLCVPIEEVAQATGVHLDQAKEALSKIQSFEPAGVGARDLPECLLIQLEQQGIRDLVLEKLIHKHLEDLAAGRLHKLSSYFGMSPAEIQRYADIIKTLDPKPGRSFSPSGQEINYIIPDIVVERVDGHYVVIVNDTATPRLEISNLYRSMLNKDVADQQAREFVENKLNSAVWLIKSIEQRRLTLYKVADTIVKLQKDFLDRGIQFLKPMNLKHVAEIIGMHESTVSRATSNKYIQTPQGVFELRYFFSTGLKSAGGEMTSSETIKKVIEEIINQENPQNPHSDQSIADMLQKERGIRISRRTVAKYRDEMGIASGSRRRRY